MVHTGRVIEYQHPVGVLPPITVDLRGVGPAEGQSRRAAEAALDQILADSFPASDPPGWTPGIARPAGQMVADQQVDDPMTQPEARSGNDDAIDGSRQPSGRSCVQLLMSFFGAMGVALLVPFAILLIGLPVALAVRGIIDVVGWVFGS